MSDDDELTHERLQELYQWIDSIPLSRPKRNIARDFADGVLMAEVVKHYYPRNVDLHNYTKSSSLQQKVANWETLNQKVFRKMNFIIHHDDIDDVVNARRNAVERVLLYVRRQLALYESQEVGSMVSTPSSASRPASTVIQRPVPVATAVSHPPQPTPQPHIEHVEPTSHTPSGAAGRGSVRGLPAAAGRGSISPRNQNSAVARASPAPAPGAVVSNMASSTPPQRQEVESKGDAVVPGTEQATIRDLRMTVELLQEKVTRLEQLVQLKCNKIVSLTKKLEAAGLL